MEKLNIRRAVVTGCTGAVGTALVKELTKRGAEVLALCRKSSERTSRLAGLENVKVEDCPLERLKELTNGGGEPFDAFFHLAWSGTTGEARDDVRMQSDNIRYSLDAADAAERFGCKVFVGAGSQAEYGPSGVPLRPDTPTFPKSGYGMAKLCAGQLTRLACRRIGIRHIWTRILSVYGPCDGKGSMVMSAIQKFLSGETPKFTSGEQMWDYLYSEDAARALVSLAESGKDGGVYPIGSGKPRPLREFILAIRDAANGAAKADFGALPYSSEQVMFLSADISSLEKDIDWRPQISFEEGVQRTVNWFKQESIFSA